MQRPKRLGGGLAQQPLDPDVAQIPPGRGLQRWTADEHRGGQRHRQRRIAHPGQGLGDGGAGREDHGLRRHQPARRVRLVAEQPPHRLGLLGVHRAQQLGLAAGRELAQQVGGVVGLHLVKHAGQALGVQPLDQAHLLVLGELLQQVGEALVLQLGGQDAPAAERQVAGSPPPSRPDAGRPARPPGDRPCGRRRTARPPLTSRAPRATAAGPGTRRPATATVATSQPWCSGAGVIPMSTTRPLRRRFPISSPASSRSPSRRTNWRRFTDPRRSRAPSLPISPIRLMPMNTRRRCTATTKPLMRGGLEPRSTTASTMRPTSAPSAPSSGRRVSRSR